jgi:hypothetical protein
MRKLIELSLLTNCLSLISCNSYQETIDRCSINVIEQECYCHKYQIGKQLGKVGETIIYPLKFCDKMIGVPIDDWTKLYELFLRFQDEQQRDQNFPRWQSQ